MTVIIKSILINNTVIATATKGSTITMSVIAHSDVGGLRYQWYKAVKEIDQLRQIQDQGLGPGDNKGTYIIPSCAFHHAGKYYCCVYDVDSEDVSSSVELIVRKNRHG